jgi:hypothetical protein
MNNTALTPDGAQRQLVALRISLGLARQLVASSPQQAAELLAQTEDQAAEALGELRELAHGIYPSLLADLGLSAALEAQARKAALPVTIKASPTAWPRSAAPSTSPQPPATAPSSPAGYPPPSGDTRPRRPEDVKTAVLCAGTPARPHDQLSTESATGNLRVATDSVTPARVSAAFHIFITHPSRRQLDVAPKVAR